VDDVEVDLVDAEPLQASPRLGGRVVVPGIDFVVTKTSSRWTPLSRSARPTLCSLP
jgi:hypothetical protein